MRVCSADTRAEDNDFVNASNSPVCGRAFFFGGISPLLTRSCTSTHLEKFVELAGSNFRAVKSSPPFCVSASWHSTQYCSTNCRLARGKSPANTGAATAKSRLNRTNTFLSLKRRALTRLAGIQPPAGDEVNARLWRGCDEFCRSTSADKHNDTSFGEPL